MTEIVGVRFKEVGKVYYFSPGNLKIPVGGKVIVQTAHGVEYGEVVIANKQVEDSEVIPPLKSIMRLATHKDTLTLEANKKKEAEILRVFTQKIAEHKLSMKPIDVDCTFDGSKILFYFTAESRVDFRELVKDLTSAFRMRIELRQIGVRHETQMLGALGNCGMACCCRRYLRRFAPVTIKMAKEQNLFLNPAKLSGICGRLLCCLANEQENYEEFHKKSPKLGKKYKTSQGILKVIRANLFRQSILVLNESGEEQEMQLDAWHALNPERLEMKPEHGHPRKPEGSEAAGSGEETAGPEQDPLETEDQSVLTDLREEAIYSDTSIFGLPGSRYGGK